MTIPQPTSLGKLVFGVITGLLLTVVGWIVWRVM
jgi:hypothetical protein